MRAPLETDLADAEDSLSQARLNEIEVDAVLDFSDATVSEHRGHLGAVFS
jgi:hypothetical protein